MQIILKNFQVKITDLNEMHIYLLIFLVRESMRVKKKYLKFVMGLYILSTPEYEEIVSEILSFYVYMSAMPMPES